MRRTASLMGFIALIGLRITSFAANEARAGWAGSPGTAPVTKEDACRSWELWAVTFVFWEWWLASRGIPVGINCNYTSTRTAPSNPICPSGLVADVYQTDGCRPPNAAPTQNELGECCSRPDSPVVGNPIAVAGGNKFQAVTDFETPTPDKLRFSRYYNSGNAAGQSTILGYGWRSIFDTYIDTGAEYWMYVHRPDGSVRVFDTDFRGGWRGEDADAGLALAQAGSVWTLVDNDDTVWTYTQLTPQAAILASIKRRSGYTQTLHYDASNQLSSVTDSYGRAR